MEWACTACGGANPEGTKFCGHCGAAGRGKVETSVSHVTDVSDALKSFVSKQVATRIFESGGDLREERRLVTCLFADLSGFTPLADRLDPEELLEVIDPIIERLTNIVGRYEGYVDKFAGDALLAFFGAPVAQEDDAHRALLVALEMHQEIASIGPELPPDAGELTLHVGVNTGHVVARVLGTDIRMDYSVLGDAVILAQRLESAAPAGETFVGPTTFALTQERFDFESVGELTLKGKQEPVSAWRLKGKRALARNSVALVGRDAEMSSIELVLDRLSTSSGSVISVVGEPGVGKSRLTTEARRLAEARAQRWLTARCLAYGTGIAYWPFADLVRRLVGIHPKDGPEKASPLLDGTFAALGLDVYRPFMARMLGLPAPEVDDFDPESFRRGLHEAFIGSVEVLCRDQPTVLAIEDLHWADPSSLALTSDLAAVTQERSLVLCITARTEAVGTLLEVAAGADDGHRLALQLDPLDAPAIEPLVSEVLGGPAGRDVIDLVNERAVGNPFYAIEIVRAMVDGGSLLQVDGRWSLSAGTDVRTIPPTIEGVLSARIDLLPSQVATTLQVASVIGRRVRLPLLEGTHPVADVKAHLDALLSAGFLERSASNEQDDEEELIFHHALVQDVAYARLLRRDRRALHLRVAEVAEELYGANDDTIDLLARHLHLAEAGEKAITYLIRAGRRAARLFANDEALIHLQHAADISKTNPEHDRYLDDILLEIAALQELRGNYEEALVLYGEVRSRSNSPSAWKGVAASHRNRSEYAKALDTIEEALSQDFPSGGLPDLYLEKGWILSREGKYSEALQALQEGLMTAGKRKDDVVGQIHLQITRATSVLGEMNEALKHALAGVMIFESSNDLKGFVTAMRILGDTYRQSDLYDDAAEALRRGLSLARKTGNAEEVGGCLINLGLVEMSRQASEAAIDCDREAIDVFRSISHISGQAIGHSNLAEKLVLAGRTDEAIVEAGKALELAESIGHRQTIADVTDTIAMIHLANGEFDAAAQRAEAAADIYLEMEAAPAAARSLLRAVEAYEKKGEAERARATEARALFLSSRDT